MAENSEIKLHFLDYWRVIRVRYGIILLAFLLVVITASVTTYFMPKEYMSVVMMEIQSDAAAMPVFENGSPSSNYAQTDPKFAPTQFQIIQQKEILYPVIDELELRKAWYPSDQNQIPREQLYFRLQNMLNVQEVRNTNLLKIIVSSGKAKEAADIANKIADVYVQRRNDELSVITIKSLAKLQDEVDKQQKKVDDAFTEVRRLRDLYHIVDLNPESMADSAGTGELDVRELTQKMNNEQTTVEQLRNQLANIDKLTEPELMRGLEQLKIPAANITSKLQIYSTSLVEKERLLNSGLGRKHPQIKALDATIEMYSGQMKDEMASIRKSLAAQLKIEEDNLASLDAQLKTSNSQYTGERTKNAPYLDAKYRYIQTKKILEVAQTKLSTQSIERGMPRSPAKIWAKAEPATRASKPDIAVNLILGILVGLVFGVGLAFFIEYLDTSVKTLDDVESFLAVPVLAVIPKNIKLLHRESNDTADAEAYRILRTNIEFNRKSADANSITFVSGGPGEGKSTTLANLAVTCAQGGYNVLIVDADLRRPTMHEVFSVSNAIGLSNYLTTDMQLEDVILPTGIENLQVMPSGILPSDAVGILNSQRMSDLIADVKSRYDIVLFDSPPILGVSDASVLASEVDLSIVVVQHRRFPRSMLLRVKQAVINVGGTLLGVVLNNVDVRHDQGYQYYTSYNDYYSTNTKQQKKKKNKQAAVLTAANDSVSDRDEY